MMSTVTQYERKACKILVVISESLTRWERGFVFDCLRFHFDRRLTDAQLLKLGEIADKYLPDRYLHMEPSSTPDRQPGEAVQEDDQHQRGRSTSSLGPELQRLVELQHRRGWARQTP